MSPTATGLFIILIVSLQIINCEDNDQKLMVSDDKYLNTIVSLWKIIPEKGKRELLCLGALIRLNVIFISNKCYDILRESNNTVICTGSSYFDDIYMHFIIKYPQELQNTSKFIVLIIKVNIERPPSLAMGYAIMNQGMNYSGVLIGWSETRDQPMIQPFTFMVSGLIIKMNDKDNNLSAKDFPAGSLVVKDGNIIAVTHTNFREKIRFHKILIAESKKVETIVSDPSLNRRDLSLQYGIDNSSKRIITHTDYTNIVVSLWKMISEKEYHILCLGALIKSNLIFTTTQCSEKLDPLGEVGVLTGMNDITDRPEKILDSKQLFRRKSNFIILILSREIELSSSIRIGVVTTGIDETDGSGVLLGWNEKDGRKHEPLIFKNEERFLSLIGVEGYSDEDFPLGSIAIRGRNIIGFTYLDQRNKVKEKSIAGGIKTINERRIVFSKISYADFTEVNILLHEGTYDALTDDDYFNFVVSVWEDKNPEKNISKKFEMLCLGALIRSNWILVNIECFDIVACRSMDDIGILTYSMFLEKLPPKTKVFIHSRKINAALAESKYFILYLNSHFEVSSRIKVDWVQWDGEENQAILVGWDKEKGPVKQSIYTTCKQEIRIPLLNFNRSVSDFPTGSLMILGHNLRASIYLEEITKIRENNGMLMPIRHRNPLFMLTYKFVSRDSSKLKSMFVEEDKSPKRRKITCGRE